MSGYHDNPAASLSGTAIPSTKSESAANGSPYLSSPIPALQVPYNNPLNGAGQTPSSTYTATTHGSLAVNLQDPVSHGILNPVQQQQQQQQQQQSHVVTQHGHYSSVENHGSSASSQSQQAPTPAASSASAPSRKNTRIPRACDLCSTRKVKCEGGPPPCGPCRELNVSCTYDRVKKRRGPPNRAAQAAREAEKRRRLESDAPSDTATPPHQNAAHALVSLGVPDSPVVMDAELCIAPMGVLRLFVDDFYTYIHPLVPFPHEPTFRKAFENREDRTNPEFLALLAGMVGSLVASFPRSARLHLKAAHSYETFPRSIMLVDRCMKVALDLRTPDLMLKDTVTVNDAAISYFLSLEAGYTMRWTQCRRFLAESLQFLREMGFHRRRPPPTTLSFGQDRPDEQPTDFITDEIGKRIYWTIFVGVRSLTQMGTSYRDLVIPPATPNAPYPDLPREVDDAYILPDRILPQPEGIVSVLTGFVKGIQVYETMDDLVRIELAHGFSACTWEQQKQCLRESMAKVRTIEQYLPPVLRLDMSSRTPNKGSFAQPAQASSNSYQYVPPAYPDTQPNHDVRHLVAANETEKRYLQYEIQKANTYASCLGTRSHYVERYLTLRDIHRNNQRAEQARTTEPGGSIIYRTASDTSSSLAAAAMRAVAERDEVDDMFLAEREEVVHNFFTVVTSIEQRNMEPNGGSIINKIRQVASTLLGDPVDRKGRYELQNEEYLKVFLEILTRLEKTGTGTTTTTPSGQAGSTMTPDDEEQELRNWADLREQQQRMASRANMA